MTFVWIAQGVDFSTPCRQRLISFKPLTNRQKYKALGSSTLLCKAAFGVPVFFGVQNIHRLKALKLRIFPLGFQLGHPHRKTCGQSFMTDICGANVLTTHRKTCGQSFMVHKLHHLVIFVYGSMAWAKHRSEIIPYCLNSPLLHS